MLRTSPAAGEDQVALTRETILEFSGPLDPDSVTPEAVSAEFGGEAIPSRLHVSASRQIVTLFYLEPLPPSARVRVTVRGDRLLSDTQLAVDADGDGAEGGARTIDFDTLSITPTAGTDVVGRVFASELATGDARRIG